MENFTPGPWDVVYHSTGNVRDGALVIDEETGTNVASLWATLRSVDEVDANANLIASAPELYAIAKELVEWENDPDKYGGDLPDLAQKAKEILLNMERRNQCISSPKNQS